MALAPLDDQSLLTYTLELRDVSGIASEHFLALHTAAGVWYDAHQARDAAAAARRAADEANALRRMLIRQQMIFRHTEALLAAYARVSLLLFPSDVPERGYSKAIAKERRDWRVRRGELLRTVIGIDEKHAIANRDLRNDWMHHDERLDAQILAGQRLMSQYFARRGEVPESRRQLYMRLFEIDPPEVLLHMRGRSYSFESVGRSLLDVVDRAQRQEQALRDKLDGTD